MQPVKHISFSVCGFLIHDPPDGSASCVYSWMASYSPATMNRMALTSSSSVSFLSFANPEKGDPNSGMFRFLS